jgi:murein DD-endopeptidase MepM/ murein hydrolase activator NlpD
MRLAARLLPLLVFLVSASGCGIIGGASPTPTPTSTPVPTATPTPTPTPTPVPQIEQPVIELAQGRAAVVRVESSAASAVATFNGQDYPLLPMSAGFWGVIGVEANQQPGEYPLTVALRDAAGLTAGEVSATVVVDSGGYPVEEIDLSPEESALLDPALSQQEAVARASIFATFTPERLWSGPFIFPVTGAIISSPYGIGRSYNGAPVTDFHHGADFAVDEGTSVMAANAGRVAFAGALPIRGNSVIIDHGDGVFSGYHHLSSTAVQVGQTVTQGQLIGYSGATGLATGPHLHWEIVVRGETVDPVFWTYDEIGP